MATYRKINGQNIWGGPRCKEGRADWRGACLKKYYGFMNYWGGGLFDV